MSSNQSRFVPLILRNAAYAVLFSKALNFAKEVAFANRLGVTDVADQFLYFIAVVGLAQIISNSFHDRLNAEGLLQDPSALFKMATILSLLVFIPSVCLFMVGWELSNSSEKTGLQVTSLQVLLVVLIRAIIANYYACLKAVRAENWSVLLPSVPNFFLLSILLTASDITLNEFLAIYCVGSLVEILTIAILLINRRGEKSFSDASINTQVLKDVLAGGVRLLPATALLSLLPLVENSFLLMRAEGELAMNAYAQRLPMAIGGIAALLINAYGINFLNDILGRRDYAELFARKRLIGLVILTGCVVAVLADVALGVIYFSDDFSGVRLDHIRTLQGLFFCVVACSAVVMGIVKYMILTKREATLTYLVLAQFMTNVCVLYWLEGFAYQVPMANIVAALTFICIFFLTRRNRPNAIDQGQSQVK